LVLDSQKEVWGKRGKESKLKLFKAIFFIPRLDPAIELVCFSFNERCFAIITLQRDVFHYFNVTMLNLIHSIAKLKVKKYVFSIRFDVGNSKRIPKRKKIE